MYKKLPRHIRSTGCWESHSQTRQWSLLMSDPVEFLLTKDLKPGRKAQAKCSWWHRNIPRKTRSQNHLSSQHLARLRTSRRWMKRSGSAMLHAVVKRPPMHRSSRVSPRPKIQQLWRTIWSILHLVSFHLEQYRICLSGRRTLATWQTTGYLSLHDP